MAGNAPLALAVARRHCERLYRVGGPYMAPRGHHADRGGFRLRYRSRIRHRHGSGKSPVLDNLADHLSASGHISVGPRDSPRSSARYLVRVWNRAQDRAYRARLLFPNLHLLPRRFTRRRQRDPESAEGDGGEQVADVSNRAPAGGAAVPGGGSQDRRDLQRHRGRDRGVAGCESRAWRVPDQIAELI